MENNKIVKEKKQDKPTVVSDKNINGTNSHDTHDSNKTGHKGHMDQSTHHRMMIKDFR